MSEILKLSPLDDEHRELGAEMVAFAAWEMPLSYGSTIEEHRAARESCGVFDISHIGQIFVSGAKATAWLDGLLTNEVAALTPGTSQYTFMLNEQGGVIDNLFLYCLSEELFLLVVTASCIREDVEWLNEHLEKGITIENESSEWAGLAIQGPLAPEVYTRITEGRTLPARKGVDDLKHEGERILVSRTGYTGEDGFEIYCAKKQAKRWWRALIEAEVKPCGLAARNSLRLEMCYPLNGADLSPCRTPLEGGFEKFVALEKEEFIGSSVLKRLAEEGCSQLLLAIELSEGSAIPEAGAAVLDEQGVALSVLTSGGFSPSLGRGIGLAYLPVEHAEADTSLLVQIEGESFSARVVEKPFYKK